MLPPVASRSLLCAVLLTLSCAGAARAGVLTVTSFQPTDSNGNSTYNNTANLLDHQPTTDPVPNSTLTPDGNDGTFSGYFSNPSYSGIDFGTDFASKRITAVDLLQGSFQTPSATLAYYWSADTVLSSNDIAAPNFNWFGYTPSNGGSGSATWSQVYSNAAGVVPPARYLIGVYTTGDTGNFLYELAFVGNAAAVPEPSTAALGLVMGGAFLMFGRKLVRRTA